MASPVSKTVTSHEEDSDTEQSDDQASDLLKKDYDVDFVTQPPKLIQWECSICLQVLFDPCIVNCKCGYSFCRACIEAVKRKGKPCPLCNTQFSIVMPHIRLEKTLKELFVHCPNNSLGCNWKNEMRLLSDHLNTNPLADNRLEGCDYTVIKCSLCTYECQRKHMFHHESRLCAERQYTCEYCNKYTSTFKDVYTNHWRTCTLFTVACERGGFAQQLTLHDTPSSTAHADTDAQTTDNSASQCKSIPDQDNDDQINKYLSITTKSAHVLKSEAALDYTLQPSETRQGQPKLNQRQRMPGPHISLRMPSVSQLQKPEDAWYSKPFYTHYEGYSMCMGVQLNGGSDNRGTHVSVTTHILKGAFDNKLQWPIQGEVTIKLVSPVSDRSHSRTLQYTDETGEEYAGRVKHAGERSAGLRKHNFIARRSLYPNFIKDDSLWFDVHCKLDV